MDLVPLTDISTLCMFSMIDLTCVSKTCSWHGSFVNLRFISQHSLKMRIAQKCYDVEKRGFTKYFFADSTVKMTWREVG